MDSPSLNLTMLGAGQEVGRSCCVLQFRGRTVVCDAGVHPALSGIESLPFIDALDWSTVDVILITHFHNDHATALPYITEKTGFRGKVYMTFPTKALYKFMMQDYLRMSSDSLFSAAELARSLSAIIPISVQQVVNPCNGISFTAYHAGHVLGACMFLVDICGIKILYTGDYSREEDRHLPRAEIPPVRPDVLVVESTHGTQTFENRTDKETRFTTLVHEILLRGGHVLLPTFAVGTAQELLLILDEYFEKHPDLHDIPIYYASGLAKKTMPIYQNHIHTMNENIKKKFARGENAFVFRHVSHISQYRGWEKKIAQGPPCIVLAAPGFADVGSSRTLLELWAPDPRNGVIMTGYSIEGTMARAVLDEPEYIESIRDGSQIPRRLSVHEISFSGHVDFAGNAEFIEAVNAQHVVLVHGQQHTMGRLKAALTSRYNQRGQAIKIHMPSNLETLRLSIHSPIVAQAVGTITTKSLQTNDLVSGVLVVQDSSSCVLVSPDDLKNIANVSAFNLIQRQRIVIQAGWDLIRWHLNGIYGGVEECVEDGVKMIRVMKAVVLKQCRDYEIVIEWSSSAVNDMIADALLALLNGIEMSPASVKYTLKGHYHPHKDQDVEKTRVQRICMFLEAYFGDVELHDSEEEAEPYLLVQLDEHSATLGLISLSVSTTSEVLKEKLESALEMVMTTITSLKDSFEAMNPVEWKENGRLVDVNVL